MKTVITGILQIVRATQTRFLPKYAYLLHLLEGVGLVSVPDEFYKLVFPVPKRGVRMAIDNITNTTPAELSVEVIYVPVRW